MKAGKKFVIIVLVAAVVIACVNFFKKDYSEDAQVYEKTLRLHIPANSDDEEDQSLKLKVRDAVIGLLASPLENCKDKDGAVKVAEEMLDEIVETANRVIAENGKDYTASARITKEYYPRRDYEGISLPAGNYTSLVITLGSGEGNNWWCVLFPQVCTSTAEPRQVLAEVGFTAEQIRLLTDRDGAEYVVKFKIVEIFHDLFG